MTDPEILDRILQGYCFRFRNVVCPNKGKMASITAVQIQGEDADWSVAECSLLPDDRVECAMTCLLRDYDSNV
ncbi:MAG: hypothetical protein WBL63_17855 [Candidatus Acidiferrum sp.]